MPTARRYPPKTICVFLLAGVVLFFSGYTLSTFQSRDSASLRRQQRLRRQDVNHDATTNDFSDFDVDVSDVTQHRPTTQSARTSTSTSSSNSVTLPASASPSGTSSVTSTPSPIIKPSQSPTPTPSPIIKPSQSPTPTPSPIIKPSRSPTPTPSPIIKPSQSPTPTSSPIIKKRNAVIDTVDEGPAEDVFLTMFVSPFVSTPGTQKHYIQMNTLRTLDHLPHTEVVVFSKDAEMRQLLQDAKLGHLEIVSDFRVNPHGTPILASMFAHVEHHAKSYFVGYTNGDILFPEDLIATLRSIRQHQDEGHLTKRILAVGHRFNVDMPAVMHDNHDHVIRTRDDAIRLHKELGAKGRKFQPDAQDFFIVTPGTFNWANVPDFVIGRPAYDNWLVDRAHHIGISTVDVTKTVRAVHQTDSKGNKAGHIPRPDKDWNFKFASYSDFDHGLMHHCRFETVYAGGAVDVRWRGKNWAEKPAWSAQHKPTESARL